MRSQQRQAAQIGKVEKFPLLQNKGVLTSFLSHQSLCEVVVKMSDQDQGRGGGEAAVPFAMPRYWVGNLGQETKEGNWPEPAPMWPLLPWLAGIRKHGTFHMPRLVTLPPTGRPGNLFYSCDVRSDTTTPPVPLTKNHLWSWLSPICGCLPAYPFMGL